MRRKKMTCLKSLFIVFLIGFITTPNFAQEDVDNSLFEIIWGNPPATSPKEIWELESGFDIDQDGKGEILIYARYPSNKLFLYEATGIDNEFQVIWTWDSPAITNERGVAVGDINLDGRDEIVLVIAVEFQMEFAMKIFSWDGVNDNGLPDEPNAEWDPPRAEGGAIELESVMRITNLDSDPEPEIILPSNWSGFTQIVSFGGGPDGDMNDFGLWKAEFWDPSNARSTTIGDLDNDGLLELITNDHADKSIGIIENTGEPDQYELVHRFQPDPWGFSWNPSAEGLLAANLDGGYGELYFTDLGRIYVITHDGDLTSISFENNTTLLHEFPAGGFRGLVLGDQDSDGMPDIYVAARDLNTLYDIEYQGGPADEASSYKFYSIPLDASNGGSPNFMPTSVFLGDHPRGDLDGDLKKELVLSSISTDTESSSILVLEHPNEGEPVSVYLNSRVPGTFELKNAYPNPFNPTTTIGYSLGKKSDVTLTIYNCKGQIVTTLVNETNQETGNYKVIWNAQNMPSGIYFYNIETCDFRETDKMLLLK